MAVNRADRYPGRWDTETTEYPLGVPKNRTSSTANDGSYFSKDWIADYEGFFGALMTEAGLTANGTSDTAIDSQFYDALVAAIQANAPVDDLVDLTTDQSIDGVKTFTESPIVPTPTTDYQAATKKYVGDHNGLTGNYEVILGYGSYTSGTYTYPNGHTEDDYDAIDIFVESTETSGGFFGYNRINSDLIPYWSVLRSYTSDSEAVSITRVSDSSFSVSRSETTIRALALVIGYLKEGVA